MEASRTNERRMERQEKARGTMTMDLSNLVQYNLNSEVGRQMAAEKAFTDAFGGGLLRRVRAALRGRHCALRSLEATLAKGSAGSRTYLGVTLVPLSAIRGSENRARDFDAEFRPLQEHDKPRWIGVMRAMNSGMPMPPVDLIRVGEHYFVRDGHHRISVAKWLGMKEIEAEVTMWGQA
jgi:hypothetical protein